MMHKTWLMVFVLMGSVLFGLAAWSVSIAQEADYILAHQDIFGQLRRPSVNFSHDIHAEALDSDGCGICHHVPDEQSGKLVYVEGEELSCKECHARLKENQIPALREAYHGNCTACHRRLIKDGQPQSGPTTCGGCHMKQ
jgi:hypothetical protein